MAETPSTMVALGTVASDFQLPDPDGKIVSLGDFRKAQALLVVFMCNHCPYVKLIRGGLAQVARDYQPKGVAVVGISSNDAEKYPDDGPLRMKEEVQAAGYTFPYLYDADQTVAKTYRAACTPDFFLFGKDHRLVYRGQFDSSRPGNGVPVTGDDMRAAIDATLSGNPVSDSQRPSVGCDIKWKTGNEPDYSRMNLDQDSN